MIVNETKLEPSISDNEVGYDIVRRDRNKYGGGVCIYIRRDLSYKIKHDLIPEELEIIVIEITKPHSVPCFVCTCMV